MPPKSTSPAQPGTRPDPPLQVSDNMAVPAAIGVNLIVMAPFQSGLKRTTVEYNLQEKVPRLPSPLTEPKFYGQWRYLDHIKSLHLAEDIDFFMAWNQETAYSYGTAISQIIYGREEYWPWIKAQHVVWLNQISKIPGHPRYHTDAQIIKKYWRYKNLGSWCANCRARNIWPWLYIGALGTYHRSRRIYMTYTSLHLTWATRTCKASPPQIHSLPEALVVHLTSSSC